MSTSQNLCPKWEFIQCLHSKTRFSNFIITKTRTSMIIISTFSAIMVGSQYRFSTHPHRIEPSHKRGSFYELHPPWHLPIQGEKSREFDRLKGFEYLRLSCFDHQLTCNLKRTIFTEMFPLTCEYAYMF